MAASHETALTRPPTAAPERQHQHCTPDTAPAIVYRTTDTGRCVNSHSETFPLVSPITHYTRCRISLRVIMFRDRQRSSPRSVAQQLQRCGSNISVIPRSERVHIHHVVSSLEWVDENDSVSNAQRRQRASVRKFVCMSEPALNR